MGQIDLKRWRPHLRAAKAAGVSLAQHARKHGLWRHTLYAALRAERERRAMPRKAGSRPGPRAGRGPAAGAAFVAVTVAGARVTVRFPSGVALECQDLSGAGLSELVATLAGLPCSG